MVCLGKTGISEALASTHHLRYFSRGFDFQSRMSLTWSFSGGMAAREVFFNDGTQKLHASGASFVEDWRSWKLKRYAIVYKHIQLCRDMIIKQLIYVCRIHSTKMRSFFSETRQCWASHNFPNFKKKGDREGQVGHPLFWCVFFHRFPKDFMSMHFGKVTGD